MQRSIPPLVSLASLVALAVTSASAPNARAQNTEALFFTTNYSGTENTLSGSFGAPMGNLNRADIAVVTPGAGVYSAEPFLTKFNTNVHFGDRDGDGVIFQVFLTYGIDALHFCTPGDARNLNLYLSVGQDLAATASLPAILDGDIISLRASGAVHYMLTEPQIASALNIPGAFNVDAFAIDPLGNIVLSFDANTPIYGGAVLAQDGDVLAIPAVGLGMGQCQVTNVVPNCGFVLYTEAAIDAMVVNSGIANPLGAAILAISDLDGLDVDADGGNAVVTVAGQVATPNDDTFNPFNGQQIQIAHLRFCGLSLDGAGVLTTAGGGQIESMNGVPLGSAVATTGPQVGLLAGAVRALDGLASVAKPDPRRFVLDSDTKMIPGMNFNLWWQGAKPSSAIFLGIGFYFPGALTGAAPASAVNMNPGHCLLMGTLTNWVGPIPSGLAGAGSYASMIPAGMAPDFEVPIQAFGLLGLVPSGSSPVSVHY